MKKAFTLIELLVVVLIIGILAAVALPQYQKAVYKARAAEAMIMIKALADAQEVYYMANGEYTNDIGALDVNIPDALIGNELFEDKYSYRCYEKRICDAKVNNINMPTFSYDFLHSTAGDGAYAGKKYCNVYGYPTTKNDIAKSVCAGMGILDTSTDADWFVGNYYLLN